MELELQKQDGYRSGHDREETNSSTDIPDKVSKTSAEGSQRAAIQRLKVVEPPEAPDAALEHFVGEEEKEPPRRIIAAALRAVWRTMSSSLTRRIVLMNLAALAVLLSSILYLNQFREGLIDARVESLVTQGRIIADSISVSATVETNTITFDPEKLLELQTGETALPSYDTFDSLDIPIDPEKIAPVLRELIKPTRTRARIYDPEGVLILDSRYLYAGGQILRFDLPGVSEEKIGMIDWIGNTLNQLLQQRDLPVYKDLQGSGTQYPEVASALIGSSSSVVRMTEDGKLIISVAIPVQRFRAVLGVLLLSTQGSDIDRIIAEERLAILRIFLVAAIVMVVLSILMASTIATPLRKLARAATNVRHGVKSPIDIPDFSNRHDEIGNLSSALNDMTKSLYARIAAIESFAADVSHELKNPLTSLRSAVETLPLAKTEASKKKLLAVIQHDVQRLDRLITDISDASRLDAELGREDESMVDLADLLANLVEASAHVGKRKKAVKVTLEIANYGKRGKRYFISGHDIRLGQVVNNLIDNARSFVPATDGLIAISMRRTGNWIKIVIEDNGPGIQSDDLDRVFERFYTDRPESDGFGQNSGLGLSITKQIIEAHGGKITAENRRRPDHGARFIISLPAERAK